MDGALVVGAGKPTRNFLAYLKATFYSHVHTIFHPHRGKMLTSLFSNVTYLAKIKGQGKLIFKIDSTNIRHMVSIFQSGTSQLLVYIYTPTCLARGGENYFFSASQSANKKNSRLPTIFAFLAMPTIFCESTDFLSKKIPITK